MIFKFGSFVLFTGLVMYFIAISKVNFIPSRKLRSTVNDVLFILKTKRSQLNISIAYQDTTQSYPKPGQLLLSTNILHFSQNINTNNSIEDEKNVQMSYIKKSNIWGK